MNLASIFVVFFLYFYGFILLYITYLSKKKGEIESYRNNLANSLVLIISISVNLIIVNLSTISTMDFIVFPFDLLMISFILFFLPIFYIFTSRERKKLADGLTNSKEINLQTPQELPLKFDLYRKLTHLVVLAIVFFYFTLGFLIQNIFENLLNFLPKMFSEVFYSIFAIDDNLMIFTQYLVVFLVGISLIGLLTADFVRILKPEIYPLKPVNQILREKELKMRVGPHISMAIGCFSIIIIYGLIQPIGPLVICMSMAMTIFGDMAANLIGRTFGKNKIRNTNKTYVGLIAGMLVAFFSGIVLLINLRFFYIISIPGFFILPITGAIIMGIIDYLDIDIDDNLTYNFIITSILFLIAIFIA